MKIEVNLDDDWTDGLIVKVLHASVRRCFEMSDEDGYPEKLRDAANVVLEHFGGAPIR